MIDTMQRPGGRIPSRLSPTESGSLPQQLARMDLSRLRAYRENLEFYRGQQWQEAWRRRERRLTFNYAKTVVEKTASYVVSGYSSLVDPLDGSPKELERARRAGTMYQIGRQQSASDYLLAVQDMQSLSRDIARFFVDHDIWLTPTLGEPPFPLGTLDSPPDDMMRGLNRAAAFIPFTAVCNATGQPAMSVPLYWNEEGLPIGTHFVGRFGDEATLFRLAAQLEQARPWVGRRPPVSAATVSA